MKAKANICFEVSWEAANKVGGIYTVIKSKVLLMQQHYQNYVLVGPYIQGKSELDVQISQPPTKMARVFERLASEGIQCKYGKWQVDGEPEVILVDSASLASEKDKWKTFWWENFGIDSLRANWDFEEPMLWATAVGRMLQLVKEEFKSDTIVSHFHEWLAGFALLWLQKEQVPIAKVFTTHATMLGRSIAGSGRDLYAELDTIEPDKEAYACGIESKYTVEKACAKHADVFTTVSASTAMEAEKLLGRKPEVLVLNGLDSSVFPTMEDIAILHHDTRDKLREMFSYYFFPYQGQYFDLEQTLTFFIVGRYEYRNKGIDVYLQALAKLNEQMKKDGHAKSIIAFIWIPTGVSRTRTEILESKNYYQHIRHYVEWNTDQIKRSIIRSLLSEKKLTPSNIFTKQFLQAVKKDVWNFRRDGNPPMCTHYIDNENQDTIVQELQKVGLDNEADDKVKVIWHPVYLDGHDGLVNLSYYDAMAACHLGVFPSYYEPWGYTPIEAAAMGVPAITTDLAGCGIYLEEKLKDDEERGIWVLKRKDKTQEEIVDGLYKLFYDFVNLNHTERVNRKIAAKEAVELTDWKDLIANYIEAHNQAVEKMEQ